MGVWIFFFCKGMTNLWKDGRWDGLTDGPMDGLIDGWPRDGRRDLQRCEDASKKHIKDS